jgi:hypothetical protein
VRSNLQYDPSTGKMNAGNLLASYTREDRAVFNVGYTYRRPGHPGGEPAGHGAVSPLHLLPDQQ